MKEVVTSPVQKHDGDVKVYREISNIIRSWQITEAMKDERRRGGSVTKALMIFRPRRASERPVGGRPS